MKIKDLKQQFKDGVLTKSKYMIELYVPGEDSRDLQILCQAQTMPERTIETVQLYHKGRPFIVRGETKFGTSINLTFLEDSFMDVRRMMDFWLKQVDDPELYQKPEEAKGEKTLSGMLNKAKKEINSQVSLVNDIKNVQKDFGQAFDFLSNSPSQNQFPPYQTTMRIWQLNGRGSKVYGYELQNAFIAGVQSTDFGSDSKEMQTITITIQYSEVLPLQNKTLSDVGKVLGSDTVETFQRVKKLF